MPNLNTDTVEVTIRAYENEEYMLCYRTIILKERNDTTDLMKGIYRRTARLMLNSNIDKLITKIEIWDYDNNLLAYTFNY